MARNRLNCSLDVNHTTKSWLWQKQAAATKFLFAQTRCRVEGLGFIKSETSVVDKSNNDLKQTHLIYKVLISSMSTTGHAVMKITQIIVVLPLVIIRMAIFITIVIRRAPSYLKSRLLGYVTTGYIEPSSHCLGNWSLWE